MRRDSVCQSFESLEGRRFFSAAVEVVAPERATPFKRTAGYPAQIAASLSKGGTLTVLGSANPETIRVTHEADGRIWVSTTRKGGMTRFLFSFRAKTTQRVYVDAGDGDDKIDCKGVFRITHLLGNFGNDSIHGSDYIDGIFGGPGNDNIHAHEGNDQVWGDDGDDTLQGDDGDDDLTGGYGSDTILGNGGDDSIYSADGTAQDLISGGLGMDWASADKNHEGDWQGEWTPGDWERSAVWAKDIETITGN
ncbi:MAG TPA: hypothetical protein VEA69_20760 [Tepidisphaeraceae bacterium]|nr:hypothetical protein [Tepidisphaeraceae bacterium]